MITREHLVRTLEATRAAQLVAQEALAAFDETLAAPVAPPAVAVQARGLANPDVFFAKVRAMMGGSLTDKQVSGINAILAACAKSALPLAWAAYVLATPALETGNSFDPAKVESLDYATGALVKKFSRERISVADANRLGRIDGRRPADQVAIANTIYGGAWGRENLGNTQPNDGWYFRGRSWPQLTGRRNWTLADKSLGLNGELLRNPELIARPDIAAGVLVRGMVEGWYTTKTLKHYLRDEADLKQFANARYIVNGQDRAEDIAHIALAFQAALKAGGWR